MEDAALAQLIVDETDRIRRLIDRVEVFAEERPIERRPVNIHRIPRPCARPDFRWGGRRSCVS